MADNRTMAQLLEAPTEGYEDAIVVPEITANNFEIKHGLLNLVQNKQFFGHDKEDPHAHIRYFNKITSTMKFPNVPSTSVKLMLFPFSLEGAARIWLEKEPPRSILTWDDLVSKFINKFFPPSKTTNLRNEITRFQQKFDETFYEAWDRFNDLLRGCPHHGFSELHQLDTFYNALNSNDQDSLNSAAGGNFLDKMPRECLKIIESKSKVCQSRSKAQNMQNINDQHIRLSQIVNSNPTSTSIRGLFLALSIAIRGELKAITTRSGVSYDGPQIPPPVVEVETEVTKDTVLPNGSTKDVQPPIVQIDEPVVMPRAKTTLPYPSRDDTRVSRPIELHSTGIAENVFVRLETFLLSSQFGVVDYDSDPRVPLILGRPFLRTARALIDVHGEKMTLRHDDQSVTFKVGDTKKFSYNAIESVNKVDFIDIACEEYSQEILGIDDAECDLKKDILLLEAILNSEPLPPLPNHANYFPEAFYIMQRKTMFEAESRYTRRQTSSISLLREIIRRDCSMGSDLQEFDFDVVGHERSENLAADHLSRLENPH
ncbi:reverse transcriptase domain-containing protein [Tanacetum coccineum]